MHAPIHLPGATPRGRPITASSSLSTLMARLAELRTIVAKPELQPPGLSPESRIAWIAAQEAQIARIEAMVAARQSALPSSRKPSNAHRAAAAEPSRILTSLRAELLAVLDGVRVRAKSDSTTVTLPTSADLYVEALRKMMILTQNAESDIRARVRDNFALLHGDPDDHGSDDIMQPAMAVEHTESDSDGSTGIEV